MFGIRVEWKDTKRFTWFCVTQYFDSRFLIWYSWFDSLVTWSVIDGNGSNEYRRKYSFHSRIDTVCNEIRRNNTVWIYKRILPIEFRVFYRHTVRLTWVSSRNSVSDWLKSSTRERHLPRINLKTHDVIVRWNTLNSIQLYGGIIIANTVRLDS